MNIEQRRERQKANKENAIRKARDFITLYFATHPCVDCGESEGLTFDHVRGEKRCNVADMVSHGLGLESIKDEIKKTDVVCFNCHAIRTHERSKSNRWKKVVGNGG